MRHQVNDQLPVDNSHRAQLDAITEGLGGDVERFAVLHGNHGEIINMPLAPEPSASATTASSAPSRSRSPRATNCRRDQAWSGRPSRLKRRSFVFAIGQRHRVRH